MLFISGFVSFVTSTSPRQRFQSRNRDAFHFRLRYQDGDFPAGGVFQSRNRDAFHFREATDSFLNDPQVRFQSRNRDAFHFRSRLQDAGCGLSIQFQSRNRDAFHFRERDEDEAIRLDAVSIS